MALDWSCSEWKSSFLDLDRWNLTNSTLMLSESFRSESESGDHCASLRLDFLPPYGWNT